MALQEIHSWTLGGLIGAFFDLVLAYFLLCGSAIAFFVSKFLRVFGLYLPCPCKGVFGYRNNNFCVHKILFEWPLRKICSVQVMAVKSYPFDLVRVNGHACNSNDKMIAERTSENRLLELEDEASCSSCSVPRFLSLADRDGGYDAKGKGIMNVKRQSGTWRRRKDKTSDSRNPASGKEIGVLDVVDVQTGQGMNEKTCHGYEFSGSIVDSSQQDKYSSSLENCMSNAQDKVQIVGNEKNSIKMLEKALAEEKAAYAVLYLELEKEKAAAASAADEAMAMISRLQEEKASMKMETRQYQRMIEERVAYDEEEVEILQEILIRRERENQFLENELEAYGEMGFGGSDQSNGMPNVVLDELGQRRSISLETHEDPVQSESAISIAKKDEIPNLASNYIMARTCINLEDGEELEKDTGPKDRAQVNLPNSFLDNEPDVLDVHMIDDNIKQKMKR